MGGTTPWETFPLQFPPFEYRKRQDGPVIMKTDQKGTRQPVEGESFFQGEIR
jgi:hypothetical protein